MKQSLATKAAEVKTKQAALTLKGNQQRYFDDMRKFVDQALTDRFTLAETDPDVDVDSNIILAGRSVFEIISLYTAPDFTAFATKLKNESSWDLTNYKIEKYNVSDNVGVKITANSK